MSFCGVTLGAEEGEGRREGGDLGDLLSSLEADKAAHEVIQQGRRYRWRETIPEDEAADDADADAEARPHHQYADAIRHCEQSKRQIEAMGLPGQVPRQEASKGPGLNHHHHHNEASSSSDKDSLNQDEGFETESRGSSSLEGKNSAEPPAAAPSSSPAHADAGSVGHGRRAKGGLPSYLAPTKAAISRTQSSRDSPASAARPSVAIITRDSPNTPVRPPRNNARRTVPLPPNPNPPAKLRPRTASFAKPRPTSFAAVSTNSSPSTTAKASHLQTLPRRKLPLLRALTRFARNELPGPAANGLMKSSSSSSAKSTSSSQPPGRNTQCKANNNVQQPSNKAKSNNNTLPLSAAKR